MNGVAPAPAGESDPRVFFAAERTLLAWLRTGIALMGFGFVIARFGLFLDLLAHQKAAAASGQYPAFSAFIGVLLMIGGALATLGATIQHRRFVATLAPMQLPPRYSTYFAVVAGWVFALLGLILAAYLIVTEIAA
ncbi:MAG: YidH family protein [Gammaproteobacteria bacterium]